MVDDTRGAVHGLCTHLCTQRDLTDRHHL